MTDYDSTPYCVEGCGRPATTSRPWGVTANGTPTVELLCDDCVIAAFVAKGQQQYRNVLDALANGDVVAAPPREHQEPQ